MITVNGNIFNARGFSYGSISPVVSVGEWGHPGACASDADLMQAAGVNLVRIFVTPNTPSVALGEQLACLDTLWAHGIGVAWVISISDTNPNDTLYLATYERAVQIAVREFAAHPASYMWIVGNEIDNPNNVKQNMAPYCFYDEPWPAGQGPCPKVPDPLLLSGTQETQGHYVDLLAKEVRSLDPHHLVGSTPWCHVLDAPGSCVRIIDSSDAPALDFWGQNVYSRTGSFGNFFTDNVSSTLGDPSRPTLITETGYNRYDCKGTPAPARYSCDVGSGEDDATQASVEQAEAQSIEANMANASNPGGAVVGGLVFMWADSWGFDDGIAARAGYQSLAGTDASNLQHDVASVQCGMGDNGDAQANGGASRWPRQRRMKHPAPRPSHRRRRSASHA